MTARPGHIHLRWALAVAVVAAAAVFAAVPPASAIPFCPVGEDCAPPPRDPPPPAPAPDGRITYFSASAQACEPGLTPSNTLHYRAPGASETWISVSPGSNGTYTTVKVYLGSANNDVTFTYQSHGTFRVLSFNGHGGQADSRYWTTC